MEKSLIAKKRAKSRYTVNLKATYSIRKQETQHQECRIINLSASGATARFPRTESLQNGAVIAMDIAIPNTIMRVETEAEIMWTKHRFNELVCGVRFTEILSHNMIQHLIKKSQNTIRPL